MNNKAKMWAFVALGLFFCSFAVGSLHYLSFLLSFLLRDSWDTHPQFTEWATHVCWPANILLHFGAGVCLCVAVITICSQRK